MTDQKPSDAANPFDAFAKVPANYVPLTPISFLERTAAVYGQRDGVIYGARRYSWAQVLERSQRLAAGLSAHGIGKGDVVSVMAANTPEMVEAHFGVPAAGAVLNAINTRLDIDTVAYILEHAGTKLLITDTHFSPIVSAALERLGDRAPQVIDIVDAQLPPPAGAGERLGQHTYEELLDAGAAHIDGAPSADGAAHWQLPGDEWDAITLNYTSGTSGRPKGVVYHHRGAYLMAIGTLAGWRLPALPRYLYVVPMFHCNGWGHVWTMALAGGTIFCHRVMTAKALFDALADNAITHFGAAPIILGTLVNAGAGERRDLPNNVYAMTAGAPPAPAVLAKTAELGIEVLHVYGLTETYGHVLGSFPQDDLNALSADDRAARMAR
ncbi:MAG: AMP-binding protein, partial [Pseudomonadota bacterium]